MARDGSRPEVVIVAALAEKDRLIGAGMKLPWHIPADMKRFKALTSGHPLIMGRKTFASILVQFGRPLPDRRHIVLTSHPENITHPIAECVRSIEEALEAVSTESIVFIVGGASVYAATLTIADRLELTLVEGNFEGDTYFPPWKHLVGSTFGLTDIVKEEGFRFETYRRKKN